MLRRSTGFVDPSATLRTLVEAAPLDAGTTRSAPPSTAATAVPSATTTGAAPSARGALTIAVVHESLEPSAWTAETR